MPCVSMSRCLPNADGPWLSQTASVEARAFEKRRQVDLWPKAPEVRALAPARLVSAFSWPALSTALAARAQEPVTITVQGETRPEGEIRASRSCVEQDFARAWAAPALREAACCERGGVQIRGVGRARRAGYGLHPRGGGADARLLWAVCA